MNKFWMSYGPDQDGEDYGWLELSTSAEGFAGTVGFWSHPEVFSDFAKALNTFPIQESRPPEVIIHATQDRQRPTIHLKLEPAGVQGELRLFVWLADDWGTKNQVSLTAPATYAWAQRFSQALDALIKPPHVPVEIEIY